MQSSTEYLLIVQRTKIKFWSQLGAWLRQILGTLQGKNPPRVGKYKIFEMHHSQSSPHIRPRSPPQGSRWQVHQTAWEAQIMWWWYLEEKRTPTSGFLLYLDYKLLLRSLRSLRSSNKLSNFPLSLADASHEFQIHVSVCILTIKINQWALVNFCSYRKKQIWQ